MVERDGGETPAIHRGQPSVRRRRCGTWLVLIGAGTAAVVHPSRTIARITMASPARKPPATS